MSLEFVENMKKIQNFKSSSYYVRNNAKKDYITQCKISSVEKSRHVYILKIIPALINTNRCIFFLILFSYIIILIQRRVKYYCAR